LTFSKNRMAHLLRGWVLEFIKVTVCQTMVRHSIPFTLLGQ
jgi:hypothetical protein